MNAEPRHVITHGDDTVTIYAGGGLSTKGRTFASTKELRQHARNLATLATRIEKEGLSGNGAAGHQAARDAALVAQGDL